MTRYAIYFAPECASPWWQSGCRWLGRDPETGICTAAAPIADVPAALQSRLTSSARRYGFHATLKAPFHLANGFDEARLIDMAHAFARHQRTITLHEPVVGTIGAFLALLPAVAQADISALAMRCVSYFDLLRAPMSAEEMARRQNSGLSARQNALLSRWGYPFTEEAYRFHMTLSDALTDIDAVAVSALRAAAEACFAEAAGAPLLINALAIFREPMPGYDFELIARVGFASD